MIPVLPNVIWTTFSSKFSYPFCHDSHAHWYHFLILDFFLHSINTTSTFHRKHIVTHIHNFIQTMYYHLFFYNNIITLYLHEFDIVCETLFISFERHVATLGGVHLTASFTVGILVYHLICREKGVITIQFERL